MKSEVKSLDKSYGGGWWRKIQALILVKIFLNLNRPGRLRFKSLYFFGWHVKNDGFRWVFMFMVQSR